MKHKSQLTQINALPESSFTSVDSGLLRRKCSCGKTAGLTQKSPPVIHDLMKSEAVNIQPQLKMGKPNDKYEQEADRIAGQIVSMPEPTLKHPLGNVEKQENLLQAKPILNQITPILQRQMGENEDENDILQKKERAGHQPAVEPHIQTQINTVRGHGTPLPKAVRSFYESRFGTDFKDTRIHTDTRASKIANSLNSRAFTIGQDIFFNRQEFQPEASGGKRLLAHELTHVLQQRTASVSHRIQHAPAGAAAGNTGTKKEISLPIDVTFYSGDTYDPNYETAKKVAEGRVKSGKSLFTEPINKIEDIHNILQYFAYVADLMTPQRKQAWEEGTVDFLVPDDYPGFVRNISIIGHGSPGTKSKEPFYAFGGIAYKTSELEAFHNNGLTFAPYMVNGGKVILEGCSAAAGRPGREFLMQIGKIFFGSTKKGLVRGNTGESIAFAGEMMGGGAIELNWPGDFLDFNIPCDPLLPAPSGFGCFTKGDGFALAKI